MNKDIYEKIIFEKDKFIGGKLEDHEYGIYKTEIVDIKLENNFFEIIGKDFNCGFDLDHGFLLGYDKDKNFLIFNRTYQGNFLIEKKMS